MIVILLIAGTLAIITTAFAQTATDFRPLYEAGQWEPDTVATIGKMTLPELARRGYPDRITVGTLAGSGRLRAHPCKNPNYPAYDGNWCQPGGRIAVYQRVATNWDAFSAGTMNADGGTTSARRSSVDSSTASSRSASPAARVDFPVPGAPPTSTAGTRARSRCDIASACSERARSRDPVSPCR